MLKQLSSRIKVTVATVLVVFVAFTFVRCEKSSTQSFVAEYQDSLTQKDLLWLNNFAERGDSVGMITGIKRLSFPATIITQVRNKYSFYITQLIDHKNPELGTFKQLVVIDFTGWDKPVDLQTEGYHLSNAHEPYYAPEMTKLFSANAIFVEHRYFGKSVPFVGNVDAMDPSALNWDYLNAEQEAADLHLIREKLGMLFKGKWMACGESKGGENSLIYTAYYPGDIDCTVPYVGPICNGVNDSRISHFIEDTTWTPEVREKIKNFQIEMLKRRSTMLPLLEDNLLDEGTAKISMNELYDYFVLDFAAAFVQTNYHPETIPDIKTASDYAMFNYAAGVCPPSEFMLNDGGLIAYFVQAAKELGYYSYDIEPFKDWLTIKSGSDVLEKVYLPLGRSFQFDSSLNNKLYRFLATTKSKIMFIYGANDEWTSARPFSTEHDNLKLYIVPGENHRANIQRMPAAMKAEALATLSSWLGVNAAN